PRQAMRLHLEAARLHESLGDRKRALRHYQEAHERDPEYRPAVRGTRRLLLAFGNHSAALPLFDEELRLVSAPRVKARLLYAKGRLLEDHLGLRSAAREAFAAAWELDRGNRTVLKALERLDRASDAWHHLAQTYQRFAEAIPANVDPPLRATLLV